MAHSISDIFLLLMSTKLLKQNGTDIIGDPEPSYIGEPNFSSLAFIPPTGPFAYLPLCAGGAEANSLSKYCPFYPFLSFFVMDF